MHHSTVLHLAARRGRDERPAAARVEGSVLVLTLVVSMIVTFLLAAAVFRATTMARSARFDLDYLQALALAEGITEAAQKQLLNEVANFKTPPSSGVVDIGGTQYPFTVTASGSAFTQTDPDGVASMAEPLDITATVDIDMASATSSRVVYLTRTPIFQYMIFFNDDLEILPGPDMTLGGRVHTNGSIYVGAGATLTVDTDYFKAVGTIRRHRKNDGSESSGTVRIKVQGESSYRDMEPGDDSDHPDWLTLALDTWKGTVESSAHGVKEVAAPNIGSIKAIDPDTGQKGHFHANAGLVIRDNAVYNSSGTDITLLLPPGTLTEKTMYDAREMTTVRVTEVDVNLLNVSGHFPANGLLYAYRTDSAPGTPNGIRLTNGAELNGPLSVVSENPVYIQGDYNSVNPKGASVMADAINLLSNAWDDSKTSSSLPSATETRYQAAFVTGNVPTPDGGGTYSGGFENLPRFHENWSGVKATIRGSFVKLFESEIATSPWGSSNVYRAPVRDWRYDPGLLDPANAPPFTPNAVYFKRVVWDDSQPSYLDGNPPPIAVEAY